MTSLKTVTVISILVLCGYPIMGQTLLTLDSANQNRTYLRFGIEPATMLTFGYQRQLPLSFWNKDLVSFVEFGSSIAKFKNSELKMGAILPVVERGKFKIINNLNLSAGSLDARNFNSKKFSIADEITIGHYAKRWFAAFTAEYEKIYLNRIEHSNFYRTTYFEDAVDGWYKGAGGMFQFGLEGGISMARSIDLYMEIKLPWTEQFNSYRGSPMHLNIGIGYRF